MRYQRFDDALPEYEAPPRPRGYFELFCCGSVLLVFVAVLIVVGVIASH